MLFAQIHIMCVTHYHHHWNEIEINLKLKWVWFNHSMQRNQNEHIFTLHVVFAMLSCCCCCFCCGWSSSSSSSSWWYNVNNVFVASHHAYICIFICHIRSYATKWMKSRDMTRDKCVQSQTSILDSASMKIDIEIVGRSNEMPLAMTTNQIYNL